MPAAAVLKERLVAWYSRVRRDLPWRRTADPYAVWVSETMLQQTRVDTVVPYYERFLAALPTVDALAEAPSEQVLALWSGLGYYRRARMLHTAAQRVVSNYGGVIPREVSSLRTLEGVGAYTAGAVASIAFGDPAPLVDGNVARVLARLYAVESNVQAAAGRARVWAIARALVETGGESPGDWNQALMELGATICLPRQPRCDTCPARDLCAGRSRGIAADLPKTSPKKAKTKVSRVAVVLASLRHVVLVRRRPNALFGGLWEAPGADDKLTLAGRLGLEPEEFELAGHLVHVLSHRRFEVDILRATLGKRRSFAIPGPDYDKIELVPWDEVHSLAHSTLARKVLEVANVAQRGLPFGAK